MPTFKFSVIIDGIERAETVEIEDHLIYVPETIEEFYKEIYRHNRIQTRLDAWALARVKPTYTEVKEDDQTSKQHNPITQTKAEEKANEGGL